MSSKIKIQKASKDNCIACIKLCFKLFTIYWIPILGLRPWPLISSATLPPGDQISPGILVFPSTGDLLTWDANNDLVFFKPSELDNYLQS